VKSLFPVSLALALPLAAQEPAAGRSVWSFSLFTGTSFGGPSRVMGDHLSAEGWTQTGCNTKGIDCHSNPVVSRPRLQFAANLGRRLGRRLEAQLIVAGANLGAASGQLDDVEVHASWVVNSLGAVLLFKQGELLRLGGGPLIAMLKGATPAYTSTFVWRTGLLLEFGLRASVGRPFFLDLSVSYRRMGKRKEGPWPTRHFNAIGDGGPSPLALDYSHLSVGLGFGARI